MTEIDWQRADEPGNSPFGQHRPRPALQRLVGILHGPAPRLLKRLLAPLARRLVIRHASMPVDLLAGDLRLRCRLTDNYSEKKYVFTPWRYDPEERRMLSQRLPRDGVFVDIGANIGLYTLTAANSMGPSGTILAFEPNPPTLHRLCDNLRANRPRVGWPGIHVLDIGIADVEAEFSLQLDAGNLGASSIARDAAGAAATRIRCRPLLAVLSEYGLARIDALKIDIEGAEDVALAPFLQSAEPRLLPRLVIIENSAHRWSIDLFRRLEDRGYRLVQRNRINSILELSPG